MQGEQTAGRTHPTLFAALSTVQMSFMSMCGLEVVFFFFFLNCFDRFTSSVWCLGERGSGHVSCITYKLGVQKYCEYVKMICHQPVINIGIQMESFLESGTGVLPGTTS